MANRPRCVYCRQRPAVARWRPFCSERCKLADLGRWLGGEYRIAGASLSPVVDEEEIDDEIRAVEREDR